MIIGELGDIKFFDSHKQLNAYVGIDIKRYQSGKTYRFNQQVGKQYSCGKDIEELSTVESLKFQLKRKKDYAKI